MEEKGDARTKAYRAFGCLPLIRLPKKRVVEMGPVIFWPLSAYTKYVQEPQRHLFATLLGRFKGQMAAGDEGEPNEYPVCFSVLEDLDGKLATECLVEAVSLWFFSSYHLDLFYNLKIPSFHPFRKVALLEDGGDEKTWAKLDIGVFPFYYTELIFPKDTAPDLTEALSRALLWKYQPPPAVSTEDISKVLQIIRSIRLFIRCFAPGFEDLSRGGHPLRKSHFKAENLLFLVTSFEVALGLDPCQTSDFKFQMRAIIRMMYGRAMELFWEWVDGLYRLKDTIVRCGDRSDTIFRANPNFEISYVYLGMRLYVFLIAHRLCEVNLISAVHESLGHLPTSLSLHRQDIMIFFWPEDYLLKVIAHNLGKWSDPEFFAEDHPLTCFLITLYNTLIHRYFNGDPAGRYSEIRFHPSPLKTISPYITTIEERVQEEIVVDDVARTIHDIIPSGFLLSLKKRSSTN